MAYRRYVIRNMYGKYWCGNRWGGWFFSKQFTSVGAAVACMRQLKRSGYRCYYEQA